MAFKFTQSQPSSNIKNFEKGSVIIKEGDYANEMYVMVQGTAEAYKNYQQFTQAEVATLKPGSIYGEMSLFLNQAVPASLVASTDVTVMAIDNRNASDVFSKQPELAYNIICQMCRKLDASNKVVDRLNARLKGPQSVDQRPVQSSTLYPEGHGSYALHLSNDKEMYVYTQKCTCPLCSIKFETLSVLTSRLRREGTDKDLRIRYVDIEPMYYDIISCPNCLYSAPNDLFEKASDKYSEQINKDLNKFLSEVEIKIGMQRDASTVFAGYYLALRCVPVCFDEYQLTIGGLWQKLSRIYKDCADEKMYLYASQNALDNYEYVYQNFRISEKQSQQICYILGDLYERLKNYDQARNYFFLAKSNRNGMPTMKIEADKRLDDIKELIKQNKQ